MFETGGRVENAGGYGISSQQPIRFEISQEAGTILAEAAPALLVLQSWAPRIAPHVHSSHSGVQVLCYTSPVPNKLHRYYGAGYLHFITTSCYHRLPLLQKPQHRDLLLEVLERLRRRYRVVVVGYVVMPEHVPLLLSEPERGDPSKAMQAD
jgi:hypothetical protein